MTQDKIERTDSEWREQLDDEQYRVTREAGTERPFTGKYYQHKSTGEYRCVCCDAPLFTSEHKYDSGSGWPSFWRAAEGAAIEERRDQSLGMVRVEIVCARCDAHLGHVFEDGPQPSGRRFCVNSASLDFKGEND